MTSTTKSLWFTAPRKISFRKTSVQAPREGEILVKTLFSGISHGTEMLVYRGQAPKDMQLDASITLMDGSFDFPLKYGYSCVGKVADLGSRIRQFNKGDIVFTHNPHETAFVVPEILATKLPNSVPPEHGIFLANLETAINCIWDSAVNLGDTAVVFGQGIVGLLITQLLKKSGASKVITVDSINNRRDLSLKVGADVAIDPKSNDMLELIREHTEGTRADVVIEASGSPEALDDAIRVAGSEGKVTVISWYGTKSVPLQLGREFHRNRTTIKSSQVSNIAPALSARWDKSRRMKLAKELLPQLHLQELISHTFPFEKAHEAYEMIDKNPDEVLQVVLQYV